MKQARSIETAAAVAPINAGDARVLLVDLNNFASFPTLAIGLLTASLRNAGFHVQLISPLAHDVPAAEREHAERYIHHLQRRVHLSTWAPFASTRDAIRATRHWWRHRPHPRVLAEVGRALNERPAAILLSAYLQHHATVVEIGRMARAANVPLILGGPAFSTDNTNDYWRQMPGLTALVGAEVDLSLPDIVRAVCSGSPLDAIPGVVLPDGRRGPPAAPLRPLDFSPVPDYTDFPWHRYRTRIVPLMASRGCQWARCTFCSDIVSVSGRVFRSRSVESVLHEMREQARRHETTNFLFLDLKLNSNPHLFRGIVENVQRNVRGAQWIGTVHVDRRADNGLTRDELRAASAAGMRRISFGLESGSQRLLEAMEKGSDVEANARFIREAHDAGISVRATMFKGFPGETAEDLEATARFLEANGRFLDRVRYNEFSIPTDTPIQRDVLANPEAYPDWNVIAHSGRHARIRYRSAQGRALDYRRAKARVLALVHGINRRKIRSSARAFDGLM